MAVVTWGCCEAMDRPLAYDSTVVPLVASGRSCRKRVKRVGESTAPCGTPLGRLRECDLWLRRITLALRRDMKFVRILVSLG